MVYRDCLQTHQGSLIQSPRPQNVFASSSPAHSVLCFKAQAIVYNQHANVPADDIEPAGCCSFFSVLTSKCLIQSRYHAAHAHVIIQHMLIYTCFLITQRDHYSCNMYWFWRDSHFLSFCLSVFKFMYNWLLSWWQKKKALSWAFFLLSTFTVNEHVYVLLKVLSHSSI